ncbi:hypothetical protein HMPREF9374_3818 [Desmospora sp. 8437]|nr:hypothetical protein HMPREF9374_3818 [Desmospora sp. 8437]
MESVDDYGKATGGELNGERHQRERPIDPIHFQRYARHPL